METLKTYLNFGNPYFEILHCKRWITTTLQIKPGLPNRQEKHMPFSEHIKGTETWVSEFFNELILFQNYFFFFQIINSFILIFQTLGLFQPHDYNFSMYPTNRSRQFIVNIDIIIVHSIKLKIM